MQAIVDAARAKNGAPAHSTTGVASTNDIQFDHRGGTRCIRPRWLPISSTNTGKVSARPIQNRLVMSINSGSGPEAFEPDGSAVAREIASRMTKPKSQAPNKSQSSMLNLEALRLNRLRIGAWDLFVIWCV